MFLLLFSVSPFMASLIHSLVFGGKGHVSNTKQQHAKIITNKLTYLLCFKINRIH